MSTEQDEFTPRERGLLIGSRWARDTRTAGARAIVSEGRALDPLAEAAKDVLYSGRRFATW